MDKVSICVSTRKRAGASGRRRSGSSGVASELARRMMMMMMLEEFHSCVSSSQLFSLTPAGFNSAHWWPTRVCSSSGIYWPLWVSWVSSLLQPWPSGRSPPTPETTSSQPRPCTRGSGSPACPRAQASSSVKSTTPYCRYQVRTPVHSVPLISECVCVWALIPAQV